MQILIIKSFLFIAIETRPLSPLDWESDPEKATFLIHPFIRGLIESLSQRLSRATFPRQQVSLACELF